MGLPVVEYRFEPFRGLNLKDGPLTVPPRFARKANFVEFGLLGSIEKAAGPAAINGTQITSNPAVTACYEYIQNDGTKNFILYTDNGKFYKVNYGTGAVTDITPSNVSVATAAYPHFYSLNNLLFFGDGVNEPIYCYDTVDSSTWFEVGLDAPASALTSAVGAATGLTGTYKYKYLFYNADTGATSNASPPSSPVTVTDEKVNLSNILTHSDAAENGTNIERWIYRTVAGGEIYFFLHALEDNVTTVYTDSIADTALGTPLIEEKEKPPVGTWGFIEYNRSLYGFVKNSFELLYTYFDEPEAWGAFNTEPISPGDGYPITGLGKLNNLCVFKKRGIHLWTGVPGLFRRIEKVRGIGCVSHRTIQNVDLPSGGDVLFFLSQYGPYMFDEQDIFLLSREIEPIFTGGDPDYTFNHAAGDVADSVYSLEDRKYMLSIPVNSAVDNNLLLIYDTYARSWSIRSPFYAGSITTRTDSAGKDETVGGESRSDATFGGYVFQVEGGNTYLDADFKGEYVTAWNHLDLPDNIKMLRYVEVEAEAEGTFNLFIDVYTDGASEPDLTIPMSLAQEGAVWDDSQAIWDQSNFADSVFLTKIAGASRIQARFFSLGFRTESKNQPWKVLLCRLRFQILPAAGDRK